MRASWRVPKIIQDLHWTSHVSAACFASEKSFLQAGHKFYCLFQHHLDSVEKRLGLGKPHGIVFCSINLSNLVWTKGFDTIILLFSRSLQVWKIRIEWQFCTQDEVEGGNLSRVSQFLNEMTPWKWKFIVEKPWDHPICQMNITECFF